MLTFIFGVIFAVLELGSLYAILDSLTATTLIVTVPLTFVVLIRIFLLITTTRFKVGDYGLIILCFTLFSFVYYPFFGFLLESKEIPDSYLYIYYLGLFLTTPHMIARFIRFYFFLSIGDERKIAKNLHIASFEAFNWQMIVLYFLLAFFISFLGWKFGIGFMGLEAETVLPYKLNGLINITRILVLPMGVVFLLDQKKSIFSFRNTFVILFFFVWILVESYVRGTRGALFFGITAIFSWAIYYRKLKAQYLLLLPLLIFFNIGLYLIVTSLRYSAISGGLDSAAVMFNFDMTQLGSILWEIYGRVFLNGRIMAGLIESLDAGLDFWGFDIAWIFSNFSGLSEFNTIFIDGFSYERALVHSSGMSYFGEGFLVFGWVGVILYYIFMLLFFESLRFFGILASSVKLFMLLIIFYFMSQGVIADATERSQYFFVLIFLLIAFSLMMHFRRIEIEGDSTVMCS